MNKPKSAVWPPFAFAEVAAHTRFQRSTALEAAVVSGPRPPRAVSLPVDGATLAPTQAPDPAARRAVDNRQNWWARYCQTANNQAVAWGTQLPGPRVGVLRAIGVKVRPNVIVETSQFTLVGGSDQCFVPSSVEGPMNIDARLRGRPMGYLELAWECYFGPAPGSPGNTPPSGLGSNIAGMQTSSRQKRRSGRAQRAVKGGKP